MADIHASSACLSDARYALRVEAERQRKAGNRAKKGSLKALEHHRRADELLELEDGLFYISSGTTFTIKGQW